MNEIDVCENQDEWLAKFEENFISHYKDTGETDWKRYKYVPNSAVPSGKGIDLSQSRLLLVTTSGAYVPGQHEPFDLSDPLGNYEVITFDHATPLNTLAISHDHYDNTMVNEDRQVLIPTRHLDDMVSEGVIGEVAPQVISTMGYQPDVSRIVDEIVPKVRELAHQMDVQGALLVPA